MATLARNPTQGKCPLADDDHLNRTQIYRVLFPFPYRFPFSVAIHGDWSPNMEI